MKKTFAAALFGLVLVSCGKKEEYKYEFTENQCATGVHEADSKEAVCNLLKDESVNNGCARRLRKERFVQDGCGTWGN